MTKKQALELLASGVELTSEQRAEIAVVIQKAYDDGYEEGHSEGWNSSNCW